VAGQLGRTHPLEPQEGLLTVGGDLAVYLGRTRLSGTKRAAGTPVSFWKRDTICLKRAKRGGAHQRTSLPVCMDGSLRPALDLTP
jgi:ketosteroid isomerase-like protein